MAKVARQARFSRHSTLRCEGREGNDATLHPQEPRIEANTVQLATFCEDGAQAIVPQGAVSKSIMSCCLLANSMWVR